jgi:hypothetical protein
MYSNQPTGYLTKLTDLGIDGIDLRRVLDWNPMSPETLTIVLKDGSLYAATAPAFNAQIMGHMEGVNQIWVPLP